MAEELKADAEARWDGGERELYRNVERNCAGQDIARWLRVAKDGNRHF